MIFTTPLVPSAPPTAVIVLEDTFTSITLQWEAVAVDCINHNGNTTGYSLLIVNTENTLYRETSDTRVTLSGLSPSTTYTIQVAAVNTAGIGSYSPPINTSTDGEYGMHRCTVHVFDIHLLRFSISSRHLILYITDGFT